MLYLAIKSNLIRQIIADSVTWLSPLSTISNEQRSKCVFRFNGNSSGCINRWSVSRISQEISTEIYGGFREISLY